MSIQSVLELGREREKAEPKIGKGSEVLASMIPSEPLALYTALTGIIISQTTQTKELMSLRWAFFGAFLVLIPGLMVVIWRMGDHKRKAPWREVIVALLAFAAWGLVMPGSPLAQTLGEEAKTVTMPLLTVGGGGVLGLFAPLLKRKVKT